MGNFKELFVWKVALDYTVDIYEICRTKDFSKDFGLKNQIKRASVSVVSNIAEGDERQSNKEANRFFYIAKGSVAEVITQLNIAYKIGYINEECFNRLEQKGHFISATLMKLIKIRKGK